MKHNSLTKKLDACDGMMRGVTPTAITGHVISVSGLLVEVSGLTGHVFVGDQLRLSARDDGAITAEVVGFRDGLAQALPFGTLAGLGPGQSVSVLPRSSGSLAITDEWLGRVVDPMGQPLDGKGPLPAGRIKRAVSAASPPATVRARLGDRVTLGVRALDLFTTCRLGQRLGVFSGSGVGKSTLFAMLARAAVCDVAVIALVGERGREVREFLEDDLGSEGMAGWVVG